MLLYELIVKHVNCTLSGISERAHSHEKRDARLDSFEIPSEPLEPTEVESSSSSITVSWDAPKKGSKKIVNYEIKYKECNKRDDKWLPVVTETSRNTYTIADLKCGTDYDIKVRIVNENGVEGSFSATIKLSTRISLAKSLQLNAKKIKGGNLSVYKLPLHQCRKWINHKAKTRKCAFGKSLWCKKKSRN